MSVYGFDGHTPEIHPSAYVHPDATVIAKVTVGPESSSWPGAVRRGRAGLRALVAASTDIRYLLGRVAVEQILCKTLLLVLHPTM